MTEMVFETNLRLLQDWASDSAKVILKRLDKSLTPSVSFIAISPNLLAGESTIPVLAIRDKTRFFGEVDPTIFEQAFTLFRERLGAYETVIGASERPPLKAPINWREHPELKGSAIGHALQDTFNETDTSGGSVYFAAGVVWREQDRHFLCPLLRVNRRAYESHYRLTRQITINNSSVSLLDLTINQILWACWAGLKATSGDEYEAFTSKARNILTDAAHAMMFLGFRRRTRSRQPTNLDLFGDCNAIAALPYESKGGKGRMIIAERRHPNIKAEITFKNPIVLSNHRLARKILEMAEGGLSLLCDSRQIYGLGAVIGNYDPEREDVFVVEFIRQHYWRLLHDEHEMMTVTLGKPKLPAKRISEEEFRKHFQRYISRRRGGLESIYQLVATAADEQKHGALLVISDHAQDEAKRLGVQAIRVKPFLLTVENIALLTTIDGAVLIDLLGQCHAVGVILDGQAVKSGNPSRGSRYNSALRYVLNRRKEGHKCLAVVISEDGMINLLPQQSLGE